MSFSGVLGVDWLFPIDHLGLCDSTISTDDWDKASWEDDEDMADADEGNEQAGATLTGDKDSAPATISGMSSLPVVMSLVASLALWFRQ